MRFMQEQRLCTNKLINELNAMSQPIEGMIIDPIENMVKRFKEGRRGLIGLSLGALSWYLVLLEKNVVEKKIVEYFGTSEIAQALSGNIETFLLLTFYIANGIFINLLGHFFNGVSLDTRSDKIKMMQLFSKIICIMMFVPSLLLLILLLTTDTWISFTKITFTNIVEQDMVVMISFILFWISLLLEMLFHFIGTMLLVKLKAYRMSALGEAFIASSIFFAFYSYPYELFFMLKVVGGILMIVNLQYIFKRLSTKHHPQSYQD